MSRIGYLLIDGMNLSHASNAGQILTAGEQETQAVYGALRMIRKSCATFPQLKPVVLWDGPRSWRKDAFADYKAHRDKEPTTKHEVEVARRRASLKTQLPLLKKGIGHLGVTQVAATNLEADDLAGLLTRRYTAAGQKIMLISGDKDWLQLVGPGVGWFDTIHDLRVTAAKITEKIGYERVKKDRKTGEETREWRGVPNARAFLECKALMGDPSDNIGGVGGIGEKGAIELVIRFGSVKGFFEAVEIHKVDVPKVLADFCSTPAKRDIFYRNLRLMALDHPDVPAPKNLVVNKGAHDPDAFAAWCGDLAFSSITKDLPGWLQPFVNQD